jgi:multiple sugar transport system ATP-binding protein
VVQQVGEPLELYGRPVNRFVASFIGSPAMNFAEVSVAEANGALWAETAGLRVKVPPAKAEALRGHAGRRVVLGVRPEALRIASGADSGDYAFDSVVEVVEPLGNEILLDVRAGANAMVARVDPATRVKVHEKLRLAFDPERLHFFDPGTETAI